MHQPNVYVWRVPGPNPKPYTLTRGRRCRAGATRSSRGGKMTSPSSSSRPGTRSTWTTSSHEGWRGLMKGGGGSLTGLGPSEAGRALAPPSLGLAGLLPEVICRVPGSGRGGSGHHLPGRVPLRRASRGARRTHPPSLAWRQEKITSLGQNVFARYFKNNRIAIKICVIAATNCIIFARCPALP